MNLSEMIQTRIEAAIEAKVTAILAELDESITKVAIAQVSAALLGGGDALLGGDDAAPVAAMPGPKPKTPANDVPEPVPAKVLNEVTRAERQKHQTLPNDNPTGKARIPDNEVIRALNKHNEGKVLSQRERKALRELGGFLPNATHFGDRGGAKSVDRSPLIAGYKPGQPVYITELVNKHRYAMKKASQA